MVVLTSKILVVDDEPDTLLLVSSILEKAGYKIVTASSGQECLDAVKREKPNLVLLDIMIPGMPGYDVYKKLRKSYENLKIAYLSAVDVSEERKDAMIKEGISDYITKPFTRDKLVRKIKAILPNLLKK